jgi:hypothetical protein
MSSTYMFQITQIEFSERAPAGCRQYYQGNSGMYVWITENGKRNIETAEIYFHGIFSPRSIC